MWIEQRKSGRVSGRFDSLIVLFLGHLQRIKMIEIEQRTGVRKGLWKDDIELEKLAEFPKVFGPGCVVGDLVYYGDYGD